MFRPNLSMRVIARFLQDDRGFVVSSELILLSLLVVIGLAAGMATIRDQVSLELGDIADAISECDQSYSFSGVTGHTAFVTGSGFLDLGDYCETDAAFGDQNGGLSQGVTPLIDATAE